MKNSAQPLNFFSDGELIVFMLGYFVGVVIYKAALDYFFKHKGYYIVWDYDAPDAISLIAAIVWPISLFLLVFQLCLNTVKRG